MNWFKKWKLERLVSKLTLLTWELNNFGWDNIGLDIRELLREIRKKERL